MLKKVISIILIVTLVSSFAIPAFAAEPNMQVMPATTVEEAAERVRSEIPGAQVRTENGKIYVVVEDMSDIPLFNTHSSSVRITNQISENGGSYRNFQPVVFATFLPYSQVYMNKDVVDSLKLFKSEPDIVRMILDYAAADYLAHQIVAAVYAAFGVTLNIAVVNLVCAIGVWAASNAEYWALDAAQSQSAQGKVSVVRGLTSDGYEQYFYSPWNGNNCPTYSGYEATWFEGVYDVAQG